MKRIIGLLCALLVVAAVSTGCHRSPTYDLMDVQTKAKIGMTKDELLSEVGKPSHEITDESGTEMRYDAKDGKGSVVIMVNSGVVTSVTRKD